MSRAGPDTPGPAAATSPAPPVPEAPLTTAEIIRIFLPLAATSTMMSASVPIINSGLARLEDPTTNLAAFGLAFALGILLESPVFALQQAVVAWYPGTGSWGPFLRFSAGAGLAVMIVMSAVAFSPLADWILQHLMGAEPDLAHEATAALRVSVIFPPLIAVRSAIQAVLIGRRRTSVIGWGTLLRLTVLAGLIFVVAPRVPWSGPVSAMACLAVAVVVETIVVAFSVAGTPERSAGSSPAQEAGRTLVGRTRFILPLSGMMALGTLTNPLINAFLTRTEEPRTALAVYAVVASLVWFLASPFLRYSSVVIALGNERENRRRLRDFVWKGVGGLSVLVVLLHLTPVWRFLLEDAIGLTPEMADRVRLPLVFLSLQPLVAAVIAFNQGLLTRSARTWVVGLGGVSRVSAIVVLGALGLALGWDGNVLGGVLLGAAFLAEMAMLLALRGWGAPAGGLEPAAPPR